MRIRVYTEPEKEQPLNESGPEKFFFGCLYIGGGLAFVLVFLVLPILALVSG